MDPSRLYICPPALDASAVRNKTFWLRVVALAFAICAFAPIAEAAGFASSIDYALFTGITAMLLALLWIVGMLLGQGFALGLIPLVVDSVWAIFWLACAAVLSKDLSDLNNVSGYVSYYDSLMGGDGDAGFGASKSRLACSVAFSWLAWVLCIAQIVVDVLDMKRGQVNYPPPSGAPPPPGVASKPAPMAMPGAIKMSTVV